MTPPGNAGHAEIWDEVVKQRGRIRAVLVRRRVPACDLDDLEQDVLAAAYRHIKEGRFSPADPTKPLAENAAPWVAGIAKWIAIEHRRVQARRAKLFSIGPTAEHPVNEDAVAVPGPEARVEAREELAALGRMKMSPKQRQIVRLTAEGYSAREIGERLGILEDTVSASLRRVRLAWWRVRGKRGR